MRTVFNGFVDELIGLGVPEDRAVAFVVDVMSAGSRSERHRQGQDREAAARAALAGKPWEEVKQEVLKGRKR